MKSLVLHYANKFGSLSGIRASDDELRVEKDGELLVLLKKNGAGQLVDCGAEYGAKHAHCQSPIPRDARLFKADKAGRIVKDEEHDSRKEARKQWEIDGMAMPCEYWESKGYKFDVKGNCVQKPASEAK